tara:strand:- start:3264 stop:9854 length:6591 start_codon:yes stop_codon:yes gene_type:complete
MAKSEFLKWQDRNNNLIHDACPDDDEFKEVKNCPDCKPNPNAVLPNWKKRKLNEPWFNEKYCTFQVTVPTRHTSLIDNRDVPGSPPPGEIVYSDKPGASIGTEKPATGTASSTTSEADYTKSIFREYELAAIKSLLNNFNKKNDEYTQNLLLEVIQYTKYDLAPNSASRVKLLYTIPYEHFAPLEDSKNDDEDDNPEETGPRTVSYIAHEIAPKLNVFRRAMHLYSRYYRVFNVVESGAFVFDQAPVTGKVYTKDHFDSYGDGLGDKGSTMWGLLNSLDEWLNQKDYNIFGVGGISLFRTRVDKLEFTFSEEYKLIKLRAYAAGCPDAPVAWSMDPEEMDGPLLSLANNEHWKDPTACAYFARLEELESDITARVEVPWTTIIEKYTYPKVIAKFNYPREEVDNPTLETASCVVDALDNEFKQLGQDILDDVFSIGDALAYAFNKNMCKKDLNEALDAKNELGITYDPTKPGAKKGAKAMWAMAQEQAYKKLNKDDQVFARFCQSMGTAKVSSASFFVKMFGSSDSTVLDEFYSMSEGGLDMVMSCGLYDMMMDAIKCLFKGLTLEQALASVSKAALESMNITNFGDLFIGLPPDKQAKLHLLVKKKLESGDFFKAGSGGEDASERIDNKDSTVDSKEQPFFGKINFVLPWDDEEAKEAEQKAEEGKTNNSRRTLAQQYQGADDGRGAQTSVVMQAYVAALLEEYMDDLLGLVDMLNKYPGAQMIANTIALIDCPGPPLIEPSIMDFIKSIELPFCRDINGIVVPGFTNPYGWIVDWADLKKKIFEIFKMVMQQIVMSIMIKIIVKICQMLGDAICKALEVVGDIATALPGMITGRTELSDVIRDALCGEGASQQQVEDTVADMFAKLGVGGAALADKNTVMNFAGDLSSAVTTKELNDALLGNASPEFLEIADGLVEYEYPQFRDGLRNKRAFSNFFGAMGNLMPASVKAAMEDMLEAMPETAALPANPSLCASPADLDDFRDLRCNLLEGRASRAHCREMFDNMQSEKIQDLEDLAGVLQKGIGEAIADQMPPLVSSPGCDDGLIPFESPDSVQGASALFDATLKQIKVDFSQDMLGNGGLFAGSDDWGLVNMVLSDTNGMPLTAHHRLTYRDRDRVDFVVPMGTQDEDPGSWWSTAFPDPPAPERQEGQYPAYVASWLRQSIQNMDKNFESNNDWQPAQVFYRSFEQLGFDGMWGSRPDINLISMPDYGYNVKFGVQYQNEQLKITRAGRKDHTDIQLKFRDNNKGAVQHNDLQFAYGFNLNLYLSDLEKTNGVIHNIESDNARVSIVSVVNPLVAPIDKRGKTDDEIERLENERDDAIAAYDEGEAPLIKDRVYEFVAHDTTLQELDLSMYPNFAAAFKTKQRYIPQVLLLQEMCSDNPAERPDIADVKTFYDSFVTEIITKFSDDIADNTPSWSYGAKYDDLNSKDVEYVLKKGQAYTKSGQSAPAGTLYGDGYVRDSDGEDLKKITSDDNILGYSRMEHQETEEGSDRENRVFYLDPNAYGGSYANPPYYIKPVKSNGWLGMVEVLFPELSPCKPQLTDLIDFAEVESAITIAYSTMPEDERIKNDPECVMELPYNRILMRPNRAGIEGIILASCKIFASTHLLKSLSTFTTFYPSFPNTFSSLYASYVVESMESSFRDAQAYGWEFFNSFKDDEFWYAFLEQSVQMYSRKIDADPPTIEEPPAHVIEAMERINDMKEGYKYPNSESLETAVELEEAQRWPWDTLESWRTEKNFEAIQATEEDAKIVLKELVMTELNVMGKKFVDNLKAVGMVPKYKDMDYYFMQRFCSGGAGLDLDKEIVPEIQKLPTPENPDPNEDGTTYPGPYYTDGGELSTQPEGHDYVGYYHISEDEMGSVIYMQGEAHSNTPHGELTVYADNIIIPIGDVKDYGDVVSTTPDAPFILEKFIEINGERYQVGKAYNKIVANDPEANLHDIYPGTLKTVTTLVTDPVTNEKYDKVVGIEGNMGVRYGLQLGLVIGGKAYRLTTVKMDALDLPVKSFKKFTGDSNILYCLIKMLKEDPAFLALSRYVISTNKFTSLLAIYNDMGLLASIGEMTTAPGQNKEASNKPGIQVIPAGTGESPKYVYVAGWEYGEDREPSGWTWGIKEWDDWDRVLLRKSKSRIKKAFKAFYNIRDFNSVGDGDDLDFTEVWINNLKSSMLPPAGMNLFSGWAQWRRRANPFNAKGELCKK